MQPRSVTWEEVAVGPGDSLRKVLGSLGYEPKPRAMMQRRRMRTSGEAEDEEEVEVLRGGETNAKPEGQEATEEAQDSRQRSVEFLRTKTPSKALEVVKTPRGAGQRRHPQGADGGVEDSQGRRQEGTDESNPRPGR